MTWGPRLSHIRRCAWCPSPPVRKATAALPRSLRVALPEAAGAEMGPLATFAHRDKVDRMVDAARVAGAQILAGGARPEAPALARGAYYLPTVIGGIDNNAHIAQQEIFGPVLCVLAFDDEEDLIAQAN